MKKYFIKTFGCQANKSDSERIAGDYQAPGFGEAVTPFAASDVLFINNAGEIRPLP